MVNKPTLAEVKGIAPISSVLETDILLLNYTSTLLLWMVEQYAHIEPPLRLDIYMLSGRKEEIRTLGRLHAIALAGLHLKPLGHLSIYRKYYVLLYDKEINFLTKL